MPATSLQQAAGLAADKVHARSLLANQLRAALVTFCTTLLPSFPDSNEPARPVANWLTVIYAFTDSLTAPLPTLVQQSTAAEFIFKICWLADALVRASPSQITNAQAAQILAAYNAVFP